MTDPSFDARLGVAMAGSSGSGGPPLFVGQLLYLGSVDRVLAKDIGPAGFARQTDVFLALGALELDRLDAVAGLLLTFGFVDLLAHLDEFVLVPDLRRGQDVLLLLGELAPGVEVHENAHLREVDAGFDPVLDQFVPAPGVDAPQRPSEAVGDAALERRVG